MNRAPIGMMVVAGVIVCGSLFGMSSPDQLDADTTKALIVELRETVTKQADRIAALERSLKTTSSSIAALQKAVADNETEIVRLGQEVRTKAATKPPALNSVTARALATAGEQYRHKSVKMTNLKLVTSSESTLNMAETTYFEPTQDDPANSKWIRIFVVDGEGTHFDAIVCKKEDMSATVLGIKPGELFSASGIVFYAHREQRYYLYANRIEKQ